MSALPNKLSDLLELAVKDAKACEDQPDKFRLRMSTWLRPRVGGACEVCMAGAVMAQTMNLPLDQYTEPTGVALGPLHAIDSMRTGEFEDALAEIGGEFSERYSEPFEKCARLVQSNVYDDLGRADWDIYTEAVSILREAGL